MDRTEMQELCEAQVQILQRMAGIKDCREDLAALQEANAVQKNRIADQDARALLMEAEHTQYVQKMERSFSSMQADMQAFMGLNAQTVTLQVNSYQQSLAQQRDAHLEAIRVLTEAFDGKIALAEEQCKLARQELQDLLAFKSRTPSRTDAPNMWSENEDEDGVPTQESIQAFLAGSGYEQGAGSSESTDSDEISKLLCMYNKSPAWKPEELAACQQWKAENPAYCETRSRPSDAFTAFAESLGRTTHAVWEHTYGTKQMLASSSSVPQRVGIGLCAFQLQALAYPPIGPMSPMLTPITADIEKNIQPPFAFATASIEHNIPPPFAFAIGERVVAETADWGMQPGVINRHTTSDKNTPTYTIRFFLDNGTVFRVPEEQVFKMADEQPSVSIMQPLYERNVRRRGGAVTPPMPILRTYPRTYPRRP